MWFENQDKAESDSHGSTIDPGWKNFRSNQSHSKEKSKFDLFKFPDEGKSVF